MSIVRAKTRLAQSLLSSDVEQTAQLYQGVLEFPLIEIFENRDYQGSNHFFFDLGHGNTLAFFDFPGLASVNTPRFWAGCTWKKLRSNLEPAGIEYAIHSEVSMYFRDPDGARIELIAECMEPGC